MNARCGKVVTVEPRKHDDAVEGSLVLPNCRTKAAPWRMMSASGHFPLRLFTQSIHVENGAVSNENPQSTYAEHMLSPAVIEEQNHTNRFKDYPNRIQEHPLDKEKLTARSRPKQVW